MTGCVRGYCFSVIEILLLFVNHVALYINMYHHVNDTYCACHWLI